MQVLPPLNIKGVCCIQRLPGVSISGNNTDSNPNVFNTKNTKYIQIIHDAEKPEVIAQHCPEKHNAHVQTSAPTTTRHLSHPELQITVTSTSSYGQPDTNDSSQTYSSTTEIPSTTTVTESSYLARQPADTSLNKSSTDDEKIKHFRHCIHNTKGKKMSARSTIACENSAHGNSAVIEPKNRMNIDQNYSPNVMKIIEEIFEISSNGDGLEVVNRSKPKKFTKKRNDIEIPRNDFPRTQPSIIQTINEATVSEHSQSTQSECSIRQTASAQTTKTPTIIEYEQDIEDASSEHVRITADVYGQIFDRKAARYRLRSLLGATENQRPVNPVDSVPTCQHKAIIDKSMGETIDQYPHLAKYFMPEVPTVSQPAIPTPTKTVPPSVRLQNLRHMQQHQQLLAKHPQVQRTIDRIRRDASEPSAKKVADNLNASFRSEHSPAAIRAAAERFLASVRMKPESYTFLPAPMEDDSIVQQQADAFLRSHERRVMSEMSSPDSADDLFRTESSVKSNYLFLTSENRMREISKPRRSCPPSSLESHETSSEDVISSVIVSPLKLSRTTTTTTTTTTAETSIEHAIEHTTTSSIEKQMQKIQQNKYN